MRDAGQKSVQTLSRHSRGRAAFTLIELILVMALLSVVLAVAAPSLSNFFKGRGLDAEARRFISLTRYAQSRAVSEGVPMWLWIDERQRRYGLMEQPGYSLYDSNAVEFILRDGIEIELAQTQQSFPGTVRAANQNVLGLPVIRFRTDGFVTEESPTDILLRFEEEARDQSREPIWITRAIRGYEIQTNQWLLRSR